MYKPKLISSHSHDWSDQAILLHRHFMSKIKKTRSCWLWMGAHDTGGYGRFKLRYGLDDKVTGAHQVAYRFLKTGSGGIIPKGMRVCHKCDNPTCVNPEHLFLGTAKDNSQDSAAKGRTTRGEKDTQSKLTEIEVKEIRNIFREGKLTKTELSKKYNVSLAAIYDILKRRRWAWLK